MFEAIDPILVLIILTLVPALELRASIPYGILATNLSWPLVFLICVATNIILGPILYFFLEKIILLFTKISFIKRCYDTYVIKTQYKIKPIVEKYGWLGVALFIGVPLPGSGVYSGALAAYLLGLKKRKFFLATVLGVLIAGVIVTIIALSGASALDFLIKKI